VAFDAKQSLERAYLNAVSTTPELHTMARLAYQSWVAGYAVHSSETKAIFVMRELHFGHVAKSFALKDVPTKINKDEGKVKAVSAMKKREQPASSASKQEQHEFKQDVKETRTKRLKQCSTRSEFEA
jgi:ATP-dependent RNA helicase DDX31/DBP7